MKWRYMVFVFTTVVFLETFFRLTWVYYGGCWQVLVKDMRDTQSSPKTLAKIGADKRKVPSPYCHSGNLCMDSNSFLFFLFIFICNNRPKRSRRPNRAVSLRRWIARQCEITRISSMNKKTKFTCAFYFFNFNCFGCRF